MKIDLQFVSLFNNGKTLTSHTACLDNIITFMKPNIKYIHIVSSSSYFSLDHGLIYSLWTKCPNIDIRYGSSIQHVFVWLLSYGRSVDTSDILFTCRKIDMDILTEGLHNSLSTGHFMVSNKLASMITHIPNNCIRDIMNYLISVKYTYIGRPIFSDGSPVLEYHISLWENDINSTTVYKTGETLLQVCTNNGASNVLIDWMKKYLHCS